MIPDAQHLPASRRLRDVLDLASTGICVTDMSGRIAHVNRSFSRLVRLTATEVEGCEFGKAVDTGEANAYAAIAQRLADGDTSPSRVEGRLKRHDGSEVDVLIVTSHIQSDDCEPQLVFEVHDLSERRDAEAKLLRQAMHDPLTGLPNRALFMDRLRLMLARGARSPTLTGVIFIDLDDFKDINDGHGHKVGDEVLVETARRLMDVVRPFDTVTRLGGDEFVILCVDLATQLDATGIATRLLEAIAQPIALGDDEVGVTSSIGIALAKDDSVSADAVLHEADSAMYRAKTRGKNQIEIFDDHARSSIVTRVRIEALLRQGLRDSLFVLHYQPIYDLATGELVAVESLLRLQDPHGDLLPPASFIGVAEHSGLIVPIGAWVLEESCRQLAQWRRDCVVSESVRVAVNLSVRQVARSDLVKTVRRAIAESGLGPSSLSLELTESILMEADSAHVRQLEELRAMGVVLEIDDFGTGYSSLTYLKRLPVSVIKIDRSFVAGLLTNAADRGIVLSVIGLGQALGLTTIAEGVENAEQLDALWVLGCDQAQGFYLGRPRPSHVAPPAATDWGDGPGLDAALETTP
ncbi:MAG: EAL domain-containing protein [Mycobacteriales bacterium]